jgi:hypothetical protein
LRLVVDAVTRMRPSRGKAYVELDMERLRKGGTVIMLYVVSDYSWLILFLHLALLNTLRKIFHFAPRSPKNNT